MTSSIIGSGNAGSLQGPVPKSSAAHRRRTQLAVACMEPMFTSVASGSLLS